MQVPDVRQRSGLPAKASEWLSLLLSPELIRLLTILVRVVNEKLTQMRQRGTYEVLEYEVVLELRDTRGRDAVYTKRERVRFLQESSTFYDYGWGDGEAFASHRVKPGRIVERRQVGPRQRSLIALERPRGRGDLLTYVIRRHIKGGFCRPGEWWLEAEVYHRMHLLSLEIVLPASRMVRRADLVTQRSQATVPVTIERCADGRQRVYYSRRSPELGERYTLRWVW